MPGITAKKKARFSEMAGKLPMQRVGCADEMAKGPLFLMKNEDRRISGATTQWAFGRNIRRTLNRRAPRRGAVPYRTPWIHRDLSRSFHLREGDILAAGATGCIAMNRACEAGETLEAL